MLLSFYKHRTFFSFSITVLIILSILVQKFSFHSYYIQHKEYNEISTININHGTLSLPENIITSPNYFTKDITNEKYLREEVLGKNMTHNSVFNHLKFINTPKPIYSSLQNPNDSIKIIVLSQTNNFDIPQAIRATWGRATKYESTNIFVQANFLLVLMIVLKELYVTSKEHLMTSSK